MIRILSIATTASEYMDEERLNLYKEYLSSFADPGTEIFWSKIEKGVGGTEQAFQRDLASSFVMKQILEIDESAYDGVIICCGLEPCHISAREYLKIPVIGSLTSGVHLASMLGRKFSYVHPKSPAGGMAILDTVRVVNMTAKLGSIRGTTTPLIEWGSLSPEEQVEEIIFEARKAIEEDGADVIILGCGAMKGFETLSVRLGVPVIYQPAAALKMCELIIKLGLSHSKKAYPSPSEAIPWNLFD